MELLCLTSSDRFALARSGRIAFNLLLIVANLILAVLVFRIELLNTLGPKLAKQALGVEVDFSVTTLSLTDAVIEEIQIGSHTVLERISAEYDPDGLWQFGVIDQIVLSRLRLSLSVDNAGVVSIEGFPVPKADTTSTNDSSGSQTPVLPPLPVRAILLEEAQVAIDNSATKDVVDIDLAIEAPNAPDIWPLSVDFLGRSRNGNDSAALSITLKGQEANGLPRDADVVGDLILDLPRWARHLGYDAPAKGQLTLSIDAGIAPAALAADLSTPAGRATLVEGLSGYAILSAEADRLPAIDTLDIEGRELSTRATLEFDEGTIHLRGSEVLSAIVHPTRSPLWETTKIDGLDLSVLESPVSISAGSSAHPADMTIQLAPSGELFVSGQLGLVASSGSIELHLPKLEDLTVGPDGLSLALEGTNLNTGPLDLGSAKLDEARVRIPDITVELDEQGDLNAALSSIDIRLQNAEVGAPLLPSRPGRISSAQIKLSDITVGQKNEGGLSAHSSFSMTAAAQADKSTPIPGTKLKLRLSGKLEQTPDGHTNVIVYRGGKLTLDQITLKEAGELTLPESLSLTLANRAAQFRLPDNAFRASFAIPPLTLGLDAEKAVSFDELLLNTRLSKGRLSITGQTPALTLSEPATALSGLTFTMDWRGEQGSMNATAEGLRLNGNDLISGPGEIALEVRNNRNGDISIIGTLAPGGAAPAVDIDISLPKTEPARIRVAAAPIQFTPNGTQPGDISPILSELINNVAGTLTANATVTMTPNGPIGRANLQLDEIAIGNKGAQLRNIISDIAFDLSRPPATIGPREFEVTIDIPGIAVIPVNGQFSLDENAAVRIPEARFPLFGGFGSILSALYEPENDSFDGLVRLTDIGLTPIVAAIDLEGVFATGILSGSLPVSSSPDGFAIEGGQLTAASGGIIRIDNPAVQQALGGHHEYVELMIEALKDFRYEKLELGITRIPGQDGVISISLSGHSPAVENGRVFNININLETDFDKIVGLAEQAFSTTDRVLDRLRKAVSKAQ